MSPATTVSITAIVVDLAVAVIFFSLSRAAGWRHSLLIAVIAVTAALYAAMTVVACVPELGLGARQVASHVSFVIAAAHCVLWILFARSYREAGTELSRMDRVIVAAIIGIGVLGLVPGLFVDHELDTLALPQFGLTYWTARTTPLGVVAGLCLVSSLALPISILVERSRRGEPGAWTLVWGFVVLAACGLNEMLVLSGVYEFLFVLDVGFGAMLVAIATSSVSRVVRDSDALARLSNRLAGEALASQAERDEARAALVDIERLGHEINNPLAYVRQSLREVTQHFDGADLPGSVRDALSDATEGAARIDRALRGLRGREVRVTESFRPVAPSTTDPHDAAAAPRLLLVDDDERLCRAIARMLRDYDVTTASNGRVALEHLSERSDFDGIVCDIAMPEMDGIALSLEIAKRWPALRPRMLFITGGAPGSAGFLARDDVKWLQKPFHPEALQRGLEELGVPRPARMVR